MTGRYLARMASFDQKNFDLEVEKIMADERVRRAGYRAAHNAATRTLSDAEFDANVEREENGGPCPW